MQNQTWSLPHKTSPPSGFTLLEVLLVVFIIGILAAVGIPSWLAWVNRLKLATAQDKVYTGLLEAKSKAKQQKITYQISFRDNNGLAQWVVHPASITPTQDSGWQSLDAEVKIDSNHTTFYQTPATGFWRMQFNHKGHANGQLGRVTLTLENNSNQHRCVFVSTLLGAMREDEDCE